MKMAWLHVIPVTVKPRIALRLRASQQKIHMLFLARSAGPLFGVLGDSSGKRPGRSAAEFNESITRMVSQTKSSVVKMPWSFYRGIDSNSSSTDRLIFLFFHLQNLTAIHRLFGILITPGSDERGA